MRDKSARHVSKKCATAPVTHAGGSAGTNRAAEALFDEPAHVAGLRAAVDADEGDAGVAPGDEQLAERRRHSGEAVRDGGAELMAHRLDVIQDARHQTLRRFDDRQAGQAVRHAFELLVRRLTRLAASEVRQDVLAAGLDPLAHLVPECFHVATPH